VFKPKKMNYKRLNIIAGWLTFAVAAITYLMTIEPTASFWDCGEFITIAYKLEIGHPPGAPLFMLMGNFFTQFASPEYVALSMNIFSALCSAFTILFLFWTITHLTKKLVSTDKNPKLGETITIIGSGLIGGLAYTFSDTFWFSAVEAEVYAASSLFTALVFWAILKWENIANEPHSNRWLILILYLFGLSIGVHLLNLLAIPAIVFVYYYKKYEVTKRGIAIAIAISAIILGVILYGIIPGTFTIATYFERAFVNGMGLPVKSGLFAYLIIGAAAIAYGIWYTHKHHKVILNTILVGLTVILIGYSTVSLIMIRSNANPPMDQNSPDNVFALLSYLNREQYGDRPLFYGQYYNSPLDNDTPYKDDKNEYRLKNGKYIVTQTRQVPNFDENFRTFFPRMWSKTNPGHIDAYKEWGKVTGSRRTYRNAQGETEVIIKPTFVENMRFFFRYQINFMYIRYFMWNFAGRQNDIQGHGNAIDGNWISGIKFLDEMRLGNQDDLPSKFADNPARNTYYFLPLILGLLGIYFQNRTKQGKRELWIVTLLFFFTGVAIVIYLNQTPLQPRERDYAFAGSFYAFAIWIGMGVAGIHHLLKKIAPSTLSAIIATVVTLIAVPVLMAAENWDDHNRAHRRTATDFGYNYLTTVEPNGIIFTNGDNDTFPLWYNQEVEEVGLDKRVCNLSYLQTDWYVKQMQSKAYYSDPLPISFEYSQYVQGTRDVIYVMEDPRMEGRSIELGRALDFIKNDDPRTKIARAGNAAYIPSRNLFMVVDKDAVIEHGVVSPEQYEQIVDTMFIEINSSFITKDQLMVLDMLYHNNWERPIYYAISVGADKYISLDKYFRLEGFAYRIVPIKSGTSGLQRGIIETEKMYNMLMNEFRWGNVNKAGVYVDENNRRMLTNTRNNFQRLAEALIAEGKSDSAVQVLDRCMEVIPLSKVPYDYFTLQIANTYLNAGATDKATNLFDELCDEFSNELKYYFGFDNKYFASLENEVRSNLFFLNEMNTLSDKLEDEELKNKIETNFELYYSQFLGQVPSRR
jgi:hypothetical protein